MYHSKHKVNEIKHVVEMTYEEVRTAVFNAAREKEKEIPFQPTPKVKFYKDKFGSIKADISWTEFPKT